jgi:hypothetical protein
MRPMNSKDRLLHREGDSFDLIDTDISSPFDSLSFLEVSIREALRSSGRGEE